MAYLIKRKPWFYLCYVTPTGKRTRICTRLRTDSARDIRAAHAMEAKYTADESAARVGQHRNGANENWENWVPAFVAERYRSNAGTLRRFQSVWRTLLMYFVERRIPGPRQLTRAHCQEYFEWRSKPNKSKGKYRAKHNTAMMELTRLGMLMQHAKYEFGTDNPCLKLGRKSEPEVKPMELTDEMLAELEAHILGEPEPHQTILWRSYLVARYHGVRLHETYVNPMRDVDLAAGTITFLQKGKRTRVKPIHPMLIPLFTKLQAEGVTELFPMPPSFAAFWWLHLVEWNMKRYGKVCFHSLRVTVQNKLRRARVNDEIRRAYLSHEKQGDVHEGYSRIETEELRVCHAPLMPPKAANKAEANDFAI